MRFRNTLHVLTILSISVGLSSCFQWAARAESKLPKETALHKTYDNAGKVIIVGAGASGLAAAKVLEQNNIDYTILEASESIWWKAQKGYHLGRFSYRHWSRMAS